MPLADSRTHRQNTLCMCVCGCAWLCMGVCMCVYEAAAQLTSLSVNYINIGAPRFMLSLCLRLSVCVSVSIGLSMSVVVAVTVGASVGVSVVRFSCCSHKLLWRSLRSD